MYPTRWGLSETPFATRLDPRFFHPSPTHEEALARLHFLVDDGRRLGLLSGSRGSGKSLLLQVFARQIRRVGLPLARLNMVDRKSTRLNSRHIPLSRMPSSA